MIMNHNNGNSNGGLNGAAPKPELEMALQGPGLLEIAWRGRWLICLGVTVGVIAAFIYLQSATPQFKSESRILVEQTGPPILDEQLIVGGGDNYRNTQAELILAAPILSAAAEQHGFREMQSFAEVDNLVTDLRKRLRVEVNDDNDIITVGVDSPFPEEAAQIVNHVVDAYIAHHAAQKRTTASEVLAILNREKAKRDAELEVRRGELADFRRKHPELAIESVLSGGLTQRFTELSNQYTRVELGLIDAKAAYDSAFQLYEDPARHGDLLQAAFAAGFAVDDRVLSQQIRQIEIDLLRARRTYHDGHESVQELAEIQAELEDYQSGLYTLAMSSYLASLKNEYDLLDVRERELRARLDAERAEHTEVSGLLVEYAVLEDALERTERLSDILDDRIKELNVTEDVGALNVTILDVAHPSDEPFSPRPARMMAQGLLIGLMFGMGLAYLRNLLDQRIRSSDEAIVTLQAPLLGVVPNASRAKDRAGKAHIVETDPKSEIAESYRTIRTGILFGMADDDARTILVTSPSPGDGKSTTASNLAIAMAQAGRRVLLLDADFRKPMVHKLYDIEGKVGLIDALIGEVPLAKAVDTSEVDNLWLLPCGSVPPNPSEILNSDRFQDAINKLSEVYDHIIVDSPPVMAVTDARILGAICEHTILVLRAEKTTRKASMEACEGLRRVGAMVLGIIFNDIPRNRVGYGYYRYGYKSYGYYGTDESQAAFGTPDPLGTKAITRSTPVPAAESIQASEPSEMAATKQ